MKIEINGKGELYWATDYEKDILYINSLKNVEVMNFFMSIYQDVCEIQQDKELQNIVSNMCKTEKDLVANLTIKSPLLGKSAQSYQEQSYAYENINNQPELITEPRLLSVANPIRKSLNQDISLSQAMDVEPTKLIKNPIKLMAESTKLIREAPVAKAIRKSSACLNEVPSSLNISQYDESAEDSKIIAQKPFEQQCFFLQLLDLKVNKQKRKYQIFFLCMENIENLNIHINL